MHYSQFNDQKKPNRMVSKENELYCTSSSFVWLFNSADKVFETFAFSPTDKRSFRQHWNEMKILTIQKRIFWLDSNTKKPYQFHSGNECICSMRMTSFMPFFCAFGLANLISCLDDSSKPFDEIMITKLFRLNKFQRENSCIRIFCNDRTDHVCYFFHFQFNYISIFLHVLKTKNKFIS